MNGVKEYSSQTMSNGDTFTWATINTSAKSTPSDPNSRTTLKKQYRDFWKNKIFNAKDTVDIWVQYFINTPNSARLILERICTKLWLEKKLTQQQKDNLLGMLKSEDLQNGVIAINVLFRVGERRMCGKKKSV